MRTTKAASCSWPGSDRGASVTSAPDRSRFCVASGTNGESSGHIFRVALPTRQHGHEIVPSMEDNHDQVPQHEQEQCAEHAKMPQASPMKPAHERSQKGKLHWIEEDDSRHDRQQPKYDRRRVGHFLERVIYFRLRRLTPEKKIVARHRPHTGHILTHKQGLTVITGNELVSNVDNARRNVDP